MADKKRARACDNCHSIKIKCELGSTGADPPCARCERLHKPCIISPPKRQKDRVAELEEQVKTLTKLLESQQLQATPPESSVEPTPQPYGIAGSGTKPYPSATGAGKKRRLEYDLTSSSSDADSPPSRVEDFPLDTVLSPHEQRPLLKRYLNDLVPYFPVVPIAGDRSYDALRLSRPLLLQAAIYCASFGAVSLEKQEDLGRIVLDLFAGKAMAEGEKSAELIQAIQAAVLYYRTVKHHTQVAAWQFIEIADGLAQEIGIGGTDRPPSLTQPKGGPYIDNSEAWRTWLVCHMYSATLSIFLRKPNTNTWDERDQNNVQMLEYSYFSMDTDPLLCQHIRAEHVCDQIVSRLHLCDDKPTADVADPLVQEEMQELQNAVIDWKAGITPSVNSPVMVFWEMIATVYLHEAVLHTPTNTPSFAAPFIAPRLSITDFPKPLVTANHITSLHKVRDAGHALIDIFCGFDLPHLIALPAMYFPGRAVFTLFVLLKLYIASTAPGNTYGAFFDPESLQLEHYFDKIIQTYYIICEFDDLCGQSRILSAAIRQREWLVNYKLNHLPPSTIESVLPGAAQLPSFEQVPPAPEQIPNDWNDFSFMDNQYGLTLEDFFTDPMFPAMADNSAPTQQNWYGTGTM